MTAPLAPCPECNGEVIEITMRECQGCNAYSELPPAAKDEEREQERLEIAAAECHKQWAGWTEYFLGKMAHSEEGNYSTLSRVWIDRWRRQIGLPYAELREDEKNSDRREARKILSALAAHDKAKEGRG
jgi:hypothetical protein